VNKPDGKKPLGRPSLRREDNNKMDLQETGWIGLNWLRIQTSVELL
jgi:hypothetical protein